MARRYLRVYIGCTRPQCKQGPSGHVWGWAKMLCSLACLSLELLSLHVIVWEQEGSGKARLPSLVASKFISSCLELLFSSDLRPILFFKCSYPDLPKAADHLLFSFQTSKSIFSLLSSFHSRSNRAPILNSAFLFMPW